MDPHYSYNLGKLSYDDGFFTVVDEIYVKVRLNYAANVMLMEEDEYERYCDDDSYRYYGGYTKKTPYCITVPYSGRWILVIDNGGDDMDGIEASVQTRTRTHDRF